MNEKNDLKIVWWNANDFYHFDARKVSKGKKSRWPSSAKEYEEKTSLVTNAVSELISYFGSIDILCLCEITHEAAKKVQDSLFPNTRLISLDIKVSEPTLQVAIIYPQNDSKVQYLERPPITARAMPNGTRPMPVLDIVVAQKKIRLIACHWQARLDEDTSEIYRQRTADYLGMYSFDFIDDDPGSNHVLIVGDLNEEPHEKSLFALNAHRHRSRALSKMHWQDRKVKRIHLYNASWRFFGEKYAHPDTTAGGMRLADSAGTYYWDVKKAWYNFDQVIVSGGLLRGSIPYLDEHSIVIASLPSFLTGGLPMRFQYDSSGAKGLSDHLPIFFKINI